MVLVALATVQYAHDHGRIKYNIRILSGREIVIAAVISFTLMYAFSALTGILESGYHFVDDHDLIGIRNYLYSHGFAESLIYFFKRDLTIRFRPTYYLIRVIQTAVFGTDYKAWHLMYAVIAALCFLLAYVYARLNKCPMWLSYVFTVIIYVGGGQSPALWRLGPQEAFGMILLTITLILLHIDHKKRSAWVKVFLLLSIILLAGVKESFLIIVPFFPLIILKWTIEETEDEYPDHKEVILNAIRKTLRENIYLILLCFIVFAVSVYIILFKVGTNEIEYAGIDASFGLTDYLSGMARIVIGSFRPYIAILLVSHIIPGRKISTVTGLIITDMLIGIQMVLYAKSGMFERYLLPSTMMVCLVWFTDLYRTFGAVPPTADRDEDFNSVDTGSKIAVIKAITPYTALSLAFFILCLFSVNDIKRNSYIYAGRNDQQMALSYARDGAATTQMLDRVGELAERDDVVMVDIMAEPEVSAGIYLKDRFGLENVFGYSIEEDPDSVMKEADFLIGYPDILEKDAAGCGLSREDYTEYTYFIYALWARNK